jgi:hypothetical protein
MIEARLKVLEARSERLETGFQRMEVGFARLEEKLSHVASRDDLSRVEARLLSEVAEIRGKVANLPTTWNIIAILAALLFGIAGLVYATDNFLERSRSPVMQAPKA